MTSAGVKVKEKKTNKQTRKLLTLALPNQSNAVIYYITSAFWFSSLTQKEKKTRTGQEGAEGVALQKSISIKFFIYRVSPQRMPVKSKNVQQEQVPCFLKENIQKGLWFLQLMLTKHLL